MAERAIKPRLRLNFKQVWAALMELREVQQERSAEFDRGMQELREVQQERSAEFDRGMQELREAQKERSAEFDRGMQELREAQKETDRQMKKTDKEIKELSKNIGGLNNSLGKLIEQMFSAQLWDKFDALGYEFTKGGNAKFKENKRLMAEVDIFLENGKFAMPVEVKTHLREEDVDKHIERIERIRGYMDRREDKRQLVGAVAGGVVPDEVRQYAQSRGLYVLEQSGESVIIAESPDGFIARIWQPARTRARVHHRRPHRPNLAAGANPRPRSPQAASSPESGSRREPAPAFTTGRPQLGSSKT